MKKNKTNNLREAGNIKITLREDENNKIIEVYSSEKMSKRLEDTYKILDKKYSVFVKKSIKNPKSLELLHIQTDLLVSLGELVDRIKALKKINK